MERWRLPLRLQLRQPEFDDSNGIFNGFELLADALDGFLVTHRSLVPSSRPSSYSRLDRLAKLGKCLDSTGALPGLGVPHVGSRTGVVMVGF